jgi:iron complex transport system ATP-binding protein
MAGVELRGVSVSFNGTRAVDGLDLRAEPGAWVGLIGPNGAVKTTVLRSIAGLVGFEGEIRVGGTSLGELGRRRLARTIAYVPQRPLIPRSMEVSEYVLLGRTPHISYLGTERRHDREVASTLIDRLELGGFSDRPLGSLSGGEVQRAVLARALAQEGSVLLLDEPTSALDVGRQQEVLELVDGLRRERALTVLSAMHDLTLAGQFPERLLLLDRGRAAVSGTAGEVLTEERIRRHYGATVRVIAQDSGEVAVIPMRAGS